MSSSGTVYTVVVVLTDSDGVLSAEATIDNGGELAFYNTYTEATPEKICVPIVIRKILLNCSDRFMTPAGFRFVLTDQNGNSQYASSNLIGTAGFVLNYSDADVGKTFIYTIREIDTGIADMEYSQMVYTVRVTIELDEGNNELVAQVKVNGFEMNRVVLTFVNTYDSEIPEEPTEPSEPSDPTEPQKPGDDDTPDTGDRSNLFFWSMMASISLFAFYVLKEMTRRGKYSV